MKVQEFYDVVHEANKRHQEYINMQGNIDLPIARKEEDVEYWIAVVAFEKGKNELSRKG